MTGIDERQTLHVCWDNIIRRTPIWSGLPTANGCHAKGMIINQLWTMLLACSATSKSYKNVLTLLQTCHVLHRPNRHQDMRSSSISRGCLLALHTFWLRKRFPFCAHVFQLCPCTTRDRRHSGTQVLSTALSKGYQPVTTTFLIHPFVTGKHRVVCGKVMTTLISISSR